MKDPALALIELKSIARGFVAADAVVKKAPVKVLRSTPICCGKFMLLFAGEVADVEESVLVGKTTAGDMLINDLFLPYVHPKVLPAVSGVVDIKKFGALGIIESFSIASIIVAADKAIKTAPIELVDVRLASGMGGKGYLVVTGDLADVESSIAAAKELVKKEGMLAGCEIIASPHKDLLERGVYF